MKVKYDKEADALYIEIKATTVTTKRLDEDIAVDYDSEGQIAGIEILSAKERVFGGKKPKSILLENLVAG
jgi:uncharacterized protein YuzE